MPLHPKTLDVIGSYSKNEQLHMYRKARELKQAYIDNNTEALDIFRSGPNDQGVYEVFLEDSTRTKESFRNALGFHQISAHMFDGAHSSFNKKESYSDTFNMLTGYNTNLFIVRSKLEGVCTWLDHNGQEYARRNNLPFRPLFINAGDGKHEHPTQEMLDEFTFLEKNNWDTSSVHIALVGDLLHGRTVHSKVDGLNIFDSVRVDCIAPKEIAMPSSYIEIMKSNGFEVRIFDSLDTYFDQSDRAHVYYFTRVQLERMGDDILKKESALRKAITFRKDHLQFVDETVDTFFHPLPRHKEKPVLPSFLDNTGLNGRETQSRNGMFIRIIIIGALLGVSHIVDDFTGEGIIKDEYVDDFIREVDPKGSSEKSYSEGVRPIENGIVIDHIGKGTPVRQIKQQITKIVSLLKLYGKGGEWVSHSSDRVNFKGIIFRPGYTMNSTEIRKLAAIAPGCTLNFIIDKVVATKLRLSMPPKLYNFSTLSCKNTHCISFLSHHEQVPASFVREENNIFSCIYCGKHHKYGEVRDI